MDIAKRFDLVESFHDTVLADAAWFAKQAATIKPRQLGSLLTELVRQMRASERGCEPLPWYPGRVVWPNVGLEGVGRYRLEGLGGHDPRV